MARRGENIYKRKDGRWEGRIPNGVYQNGRKKYRSIYSSSYADLKTKMRKAEAASKSVPTHKVYYMKDAFHIWFQDSQYAWKASTYSCYLQLLDRHLIPAIGEVPIHQLDNAILHRFIEEKKQQNLSDSYINDMIHLTIRTLRYLKDTCGYSIIIPSITTKKNYYSEKTLPSRATMNRLENYLLERASDSTCLGILLCCHTGLRIGELCALQWKEVDLAGGVLHVRKTMQRVTIHEEKNISSKIMISLPKTERSVRDIPLSTSMLELLNKYQREEEAYLIQGSRMPYAEPRTVQYRFRGILKQCGITPFNFHMIRHVFATRCVTLGFDVNSISELLGHSNIQITLNRYVHSSNERKRSLMEQFQL